VSKLLIFYNEALDTEVELRGTSLFIGRGTDSDVVLSDPSKTLSRRHVQVVFEQGRYILVDQNSRNGIWVGGRRVPSAVLEPGVRVEMGAYTLLLNATAAVATGDETMIISREDADQWATIFLANQVVPPAAVAAPAPPPPSPAPAPAPAPAPHAEVAAPKHSEATVITTVAELAAAAAHESASAVKPPAAAHAPAPPVAAPAPPAVVPAPTAAQTPAHTSPAVPSAAAPKPAPAAPAAPTASTPVPAAPAAPKPAPTAAPVAAAKPAVVATAAAPAKPVDVAKPAAAPVKPAAPAAASEPAKPAAAKDADPSKPVAHGGSRRTVYVAAAAVLLLLVGGGVYYRFGRTVTTDTPSTVVAQVEPAVAPSSTPQPPVAPATPPADVPAAAPSNTVAAGTPKPVATPKPAAVPAPAKAAAPRPAAAVVEAPIGKTQRETPPDLQGLFEKARSATIAGDYLAAIAGFEQILKLDANYPNAANLLGVARGGARNAAQLAIDAGNKAEMSGDYTLARNQYDHAAELDPDAPAVASAIRRLVARMQGEGEAAFRSARQYDATGKTKDAIASYETAIRLLPATHDSVSVARARLAALKGGA